MSTGFFAPEARHSVQVRKPVKVWSSGALGGYVPCRHPWLESAASHIGGADYGPTLGSAGSAPATHNHQLPIWLMAECMVTSVVRSHEISVIHPAKDRTDRENEHGQDDVL